MRPVAPICRDETAVVPERLGFRHAEATHRFADPTKVANDGASVVEFVRSGDEQNRVVVLRELGEYASLRALGRLGVSVRVGAALDNPQDLLAEAGHGRSGGIGWQAVFDGVGQGRGASAPRDSFPSLNPQYGGWTHAGRPFRIRPGSNA